MDNNFNNENKDKKPWDLEQNDKAPETKPWDAPVEADDYEPPVFAKKEAPVEEAPVEEAPVEETPAEEAPEVQAPAEEAPAQEAPKEPDFKSQRYVPPYYENNASNADHPLVRPPHKKNNSNKPLVILSLVCIACVLIMSAMVYFIWSSGILEPNPDRVPIGSDTATDNETPSDDQTASSNTNEDTSSTDDTNVNIEIEDADGDKLTYGQVYEKCAPAAVGILCTKYVSYSSLFGQGATYEERYVGSGFIIDEDGYIATNAHVVSGMDKLVVYLADGRQIQATLIGCDDLSDIAVVKIESKEPLPVMEFGDSTVLKVGDVVTAIGTPAHISLAGTFTQGIISAVDRAVMLDENNVKRTMRLLQTDATINPGNSGGPLLNMYGQVIGINTLKLTDEYEGIGFAIPSMYAKKVVEAIIENGGDVDFDPENGYVSIDETPQMGIANSQDITEAMSTKYGVPVGVQILLLEQGCSLEKSGARVGDIITEMNGVKVSNLEELRTERDKVKPRTKATIKVYRNGEYYDITFTMGSNVSTK